MTVSRPKAAATIALLLALASSGCGNDSPPTASEGAAVEFLSHVNHGCSSEGVDRRDSDGCAYLRGFDCNGDTLLLDIHFEANCCPEFVEMVSFENPTITIAVVDTLHGCRCTCAYGNVFSFICTVSGDVGISFCSGVPDNPCICAFDTLITLPR